MRRAGKRDKEGKIDQKSEHIKIKLKNQKEE